MCTWKNVQPHQPLGKCKSKPQWGTNTRSLGWLLSKKKKEEEENNKWVKDVKELEPLYTMVGMWSGAAAIENSLVVP